MIDMNNPLRAAGISRRPEGVSLSKRPAAGAIEIKKPGMIRAFCLTINAPFYVEDFSN